MCSCQRTRRSCRRGKSPVRRSGKLDCSVKVVGVTGFEPVTLRLSSACSNQLSYTPTNSSLLTRHRLRRARLVRRLLLKAVPPVRSRAGLAAEAGGAEGIRTPDLQLAKLPLYQLSYSPTIFIAAGWRSISSFT